MPSNPRWSSWDLEGEARSKGIPPPNLTGRRTKTNLGQMIIEPYWAPFPTTLWPNLLFQSWSPGRSCMAGKPRTSTLPFAWPTTSFQRPTVASQPLESISCLGLPVNGVPYADEFLLPLAVIGQLGRGSMVLICGSKYQQHRGITLHGVRIAIYFRRSRERDCTKR